VTKKVILCGKNLINYEHNHGLFLNGKQVFIANFCSTDELW